MSLFSRNFLKLLSAFQFGDDALHEVEESVFMRVAGEFVDYIIGGVRKALGIQRAVDFPQSLNIPTDAFPDGEDV